MRFQTRAAWMLTAMIVLVAGAARAGDVARLNRVTGSTWCFAYYMCGDYRAVIWTFGKEPRTSAGEFVLDCEDVLNEPGYLTVEGGRFVLRADIGDQQHEFRFTVKGETALGTYRLKEINADTGAIITYPEIPMEGLTSGLGK